MRYAIYLDDERSPKSDTAPGGLPWVICRSGTEFFNLIKSYGCAPVYVSFDHDLGENSEDGYHIAKVWVYNTLYGVGLGIPDDFGFNVHSANPVGAENIQKYLDNFLESRHELFYENKLDK